MARTGSFGRLPRAVPSLTSVMVSLAREQANQEDQNITDAWNKGGMFNGKKATDSEMLKHWQGRLKDIAKDDPLYDTYKNTVMQYEYAIAESKMTVKYAQGKVSEQGAAQFYLNWAKKVPHDSEFWRVLQRDAAQHIAASRNRARASVRDMSEKNYQTSQTATFNQHERTGDYLTGVLTNVAIAQGIIDKGQDFGNFDLSDPGVMLDVLSTINGKAPASVAAGMPTQWDSANPGRVLYRDPQTGADITAGDVQKQLHVLDPHYSGQVSLGYYAQTMRDQNTGQGIRLTAAKKTGHSGDANAIESQQRNTIQTATNVEAWPVEESYSKLNDVFMHTWGDAHTSVPEKTRAWNTYILGLGNLTAKTKDPALKSILTAEIEGNPNIETLKTQMGGLDANTGQPAAKGDGAATFQSAQVLLAETDAVNASVPHDPNGYVWAYGGVVGEGANAHFEPGAGTTMGAVLRSQVASVSAGDPISVTVPQSGGLPPLTVLVAGKDITAKFTSPTGTDIGTATPLGAIVGKSYTLPNGTMVGVPGGADNKSMTFTMTPPWAQGVGVEWTGNGMVLHMGNVQADVNDAKNFQQTGVNNTTGMPEVSVLNATGLVVDPSRAITPDPLNDSHSPTVAYNVAVIGKDGLAMLVQSNPGVAASIDEEMHVHTGSAAQYDQTGAVVGYVGGDANAYNHGAYVSSILAGQHDTSTDILSYEDGALTRMLAPRDSSAIGFGGRGVTPVVNAATGFTIGQTTDFNILAGATPGNPNIPTPPQTGREVPSIKWGPNGLVVPEWWASGGAGSAHVPSPVANTYGPNPHGPSGPGPQPFMLPASATAFYGNVSSPFAQPPQSTQPQVIGTTSPYSGTPTAGSGTNTGTHPGGHGPQEY